MKYGTALGAGMGGISAAHAILAAGGSAIAPALAAAMVAAAAGGAILGAAALVAKLVGVFDQERPTKIGR